MIRGARWLAIAVLAVLPCAGGCYYYVPVSNSSTGSDVPPVGDHIAFDLTDRGRAELANRLGPGILRLEGTLTQEESSGYSMAVWRVSQIGGVSSRWSGEIVTINRDFVGSVLERRLSRQKTILVSAATVGGLFLFARSQGILGSYNGSGDTTVTQPPTSSRGWW